jgi:hypothetical protein
MARGGASMILTEQSKQNMAVQMNKLKKLAPEKARKGMIRFLFDIKGAAQLKLKYDKHIVTSRLRNSIYVQTNKENETAMPDNGKTYKDNEGKQFTSTLDVQLNDNEGAVGTNVGYANKIEFLYDSFLYWALKNSDINKRWRQVSDELLEGLR